MFSLRLLLLLTLVSTGCQWGGMRQWGAKRQPAKFVEPTLPMSISRHELVDYLNMKNKGLESWRCMDTQVHVSLPEHVIPWKLNGSIACSAPSQFRLVSHNMVAHADFGSNSEICWAYIKPGDSTVLTWKHEDSYLLQLLPGGLPRLEPDWLMVVLGVQPLNADHYELQNAPAGSKELWLVAVEDAADGTSLRRVIKVDTVEGVVREHALYNSEKQPLLRAHLSEHRSCGGHRLPHSVRIDFPMTETTLTLRFKGIETDCEIEESLWQPPHDKNLEFVDLGDVVRVRMQNDPEFQRMERNRHRLHGASQTAFAPKSDSHYDGRPTPEAIHDDPSRNRLFLQTGEERFLEHETEDSVPQWDGESDSALPEFDESESIDSEIPHFDIVAPAEPARKRSFWPRFGR